MPRRDDLWPLVAPQARRHAAAGQAAVGQSRATARPDAGADTPYTADWPLLPVLAVLAIAWLILSWPWLSGRWTIPWDAKAEFLPQIQFLAQSIAGGEWPFWSPYLFSGHPQIADPQSQIFAPPFLLLALFNANPGPAAADATVLAAILAGSAAGIVWFRDSGWHWSGALVAALGFGFGAAMAWRIQHYGQVLSLVYMMIAWMLLERALVRGSRPYGLAAGMVAGLMVLGRDQVALLGVYLLFARTLWTLAGADRPAAVRPSLRRRLSVLIAGGLGGLAVIAAPVILTLLVAEQSNRPAIDVVGAGRGSLHPAQLLTLLAADLFNAAGEMRDYWGPPSLTWSTTGLYTAQNVGILYIGALPALAVLIGLVTGRLFAREVVFVTVSAALLVIYALGWYTPVFGWMHALMPGVDFFRRPADAVFPIGLLLSLAAGYVVHALYVPDYCSPGPVRLGPSHVAAILCILALAILSAVAIALHFDRLAVVRTPLLVASLAFVASAGVLAFAIANTVIRPVAAGLLPVILLTADLAASNGPPTTSTALPPAHYDVLRPATGNETIAILRQRTAATRSATRRDRVELAGLGFHWPNASQTHRLEHTLGYNPVRLSHYARATGAQDHVATPEQRHFSPLFPSYRCTLANVLGLRFIATSIPVEQMDRRLEPGDLALVARTADAFIYENPRTLPRVQFVTRAVPADFAAMLSSGHWPDVDLAQTVILDASGTPAHIFAASGSRSPGTAAILDYRHTEVTITADSPAGGFVVLNDVWHPWWEATIDGAPTPLLRANVVVRAVGVPPGRHTVRFSFRPFAGAVKALRERLTQ